MILSDYRAARKILQKKVIDFYGTIGKEDMKGFILFLKNDSDLIEVNWKHTEQLPFDIEELVDLYIQYDSYYLIEEEEEQEMETGFENELNILYRRNAL